MSSDTSGSVPVEASIEDLHDIQYEPAMESIQADARAVSSPPALEQKLNRELQYHKYGSYNCENQPDGAHCYHRNNSNPFLQNDPEQDRPSCVSSVQSWTKAEPVQPTSQEDPWYRPTAGLYDSMNSSILPTSCLPMSASSPSLSQFNQQHPHSHYDRQQSWPAYPVSDTSAPDISPGHLLTTSKSGTPQDPGTHRHVFLMKRYSSKF